jgi:hypothetical protein
MKKVIFTKDWHTYKKGDILETREEVYKRLIDLHEVAEFYIVKKKK